MTMDPSTRSRLEKLLGMLGSTFDGERANAARMIAAMAEKANVTIPELVLGSPPQAHGGYSTHTYSPKPKAKASPRPREMTAAILTALKDIASSEEELEFTVTAWEYQFAVDVSGKYDYDFELSEKQLAAAQRIIDKVEKERSRGKPA